jgi:2-(1,2-epoxy-1,2-dihydrophenyl)acetyl-CoA isomerase
MREDFEQVYVTGHGRVAVVTMNRPEMLNAASEGMAKGLRDAFGFVEKSGEFRAAVLTGEGRGFCAGVNLADQTADPELGPLDTGRLLEAAFHPLVRMLRDLCVPLITAVNGAAAGVGMSIALMGDLILAGRSAYFLQAFTRIGLVPDGGSTWLLPRLVGLARARELSLLAERLPAETALAWGLINRVYDDTELVKEAVALGERLASGPTRALAATRQLYWASPHNSMEQQLDLECRHQRAAGLSEDFAEGVAAFFAKRPAVFKGK